MSKRYREIRVHLSDDGRAELGEVARPWLQVGDLGAYLLCKRVDADGAYFQMLVEVENSDGGSFDVELNVPHWAVKAYFVVRDAAAFDALYEGLGGSMRDAGQDEVSDGDDSDVVVDD